MASSQSNRVFSLVQREMHEYKNSLFWTPIAIAIGLMLVMTVSVLLANRVSIMGDAMLQVLMDEGSTSGMNITINIDGNGNQELQVQTVEESELELEGDWDFSEEWTKEWTKEWTIDPNSGHELTEKLDEKFESLNPVLNMLHNFLMLVLMMVSINYLMGALYQDRKDRSILFWKSMPVSEWEEVLSKLGVALLVAPLVFLAASVLTQVAYILLAMFMLTRMGLDSFQLIIGHIDFGSLFFNQLSGWLLAILWLAPLYAWLLLASAAAKRSPFMLAFGPIIAVVVVEEIFFGTEFLADAISYHIPHFVDDGDTVGFFLYGPQWSSISYPNMFGGLLFAVLALWGAVYLRRYRFEV